MEKSIEFYLKIILIGLLLICLLKMPYGYYKFIRLSVTFSFIYFAFNNRNKSILVVVWILLAFLFNPFYKIFFTKFIWNVIDVLVAIFIFSTFYLDRNNMNKIKSKD